MDSPTSKNCLLVLFLALSLVNAVPYNYNYDYDSVERASDIETFEQFKQYFKKQYRSDEAEDQARTSVERFIDYAMINSDYLSYKYEITSVDDMPSDESDADYQRTNDEHGFLESSQVPEHFNWTEKLNLRYDSEMMYQGRCSSCWVFAAAAVIEANLARRCGHNPPVIISRQQILDCSGQWAPSENHCRNARPVPTAFLYAQDNGVNTESDYPYQNYRTSKNHQCRHLNGQKTKHQTGRWQRRTHVTDEKLQLIIQKYGPAVIVITPNQKFDRFYSRSEVYTDCKPGYKDDIHAVVVVGWGTDKQTGMPYWIVRNSWGTRWGEYGYGKVLRNANCMKFNEFVYFLLDQETDDNCVYDAVNKKDYWRNIYN